MAGGTGSIGVCPADGWRICLSESEQCPKQSERSLGENPRQQLGANTCEQWAPFPTRNLYGDGHDEPTADIAWPWHVIPAADRLDEILSHADIDALIASDHLLLTHLMDLAIWHRSDRESVIAQIYRWAEDIDTGGQPTLPFREQFGIDAMRLFSERLVHWLHGLAVRHVSNWNPSLGLAA